MFSHVSKEVGLLLCAAERSEVVSVKMKWKWNKLLRLLL
jgi:hypothetical protein